MRSHPASATWQYDDDGNLLSDGLWDYTWNGENRLIAAETVATIPNAYPVKKGYVYDYQGRRVVESRWEFDETSGDFVLENQLRWTYDDWNPVVEIVDNQPSRHYVWGLDLSETPQGAGGVGGLLMSLDLTHASLSYSFIYDGNGNVLGLANLANGELIGRYEYSPFGKLLWKEGLAAEVNRWRFSTKLGDDSTGWLYYGFRYYDPETGRWPSKDPIEESGGVNLYGFVGNSVVNEIDFLGREWIVPKREEKDKAKACASSSNDTWNVLGNMIGLDGSAANEWVTPFDSTPETGKWYQIPNTIVALWLGSPVDAAWSDFNTQVGDLRRLGFKVVSHRGGWHTQPIGQGWRPISEKSYLSSINSLSSGGSLQGIFVDGHGNPVGFYDKKGPGSGTHTFEIDYEEIDRSIRYKLGVAILNVCNSGWRARWNPTEGRYDDFLMRQAFGPEWVPGPAPTISVGGRDLLSGSPAAVFYGFPWPIDPTEILSSCGNANIPSLFPNNKQRTR